MKLPTDSIAIKAYLQFFAGIACLMIGLASESLSGAIGSFTACYLFMQAAWA